MRDDLTPTESLMIEVLAARYRLYEEIWTFESRHRPTARSLQDKNLVGWKSGIVEKTIRVWLTREGVDEYFSESAWPLKCPSCGARRFGTTTYDGSTLFSCGERDGCGHLWGARGAAQAALLKSRGDLSLR